MIRDTGFFLLKDPAIVNWIAIHTKCIKITTKNTFHKIPRIANVLPDFVISVNVPQIYNGNKGMIVL